MFGGLCWQGERCCLLGIYNHVMGEASTGDRSEKYSRFESERIEALEKHPHAVFTSIEKKEDQVREIRNKVQRYLRLKDGPNREAFYDECSLDIWEACELLKIPIPGIRYGKSKLGGRDIDGSVGFDHEIRVSPVFVEDVVDRFSYFDRLELKLFIFHEMYHLWQHIHFPNASQRGRRSNRSEVGALLLEEDLIKNLSPETPKEFMSKWLAFLANRVALINERKK